MADWKAKRFWKEVSVTEAGDGFAVLLDTRPLKTPAKADLVVPTRLLADMVADEWRAQEGEIDPNVMPVTRGANAAIDKVRIQHGEVADLLADYGDADLLCYRAESPEELAQRQADGWDPLLDWASNVLSAPLAVRHGIMHAPQDATSLRLLRARVHGLSDFELAAFHDLVSLSGSLILAFAVAERHLDAETAWGLSRIDETYQAELWGEDEEAAEAAEIKRQAFFNAAAFFHAVKKTA